MVYAKESPFFTSLTCLIAGIYVQAAYAFSMELLLGCVCLVVIGFITNEKMGLDALGMSGPVSSFLVGLLFFFSGGILLQAQRDMHDQLVKLYADRQIDIVCTVQDCTQRPAYERGQVIQVRVSDVRDCESSVSRSVDFTLMIYTSSRLPIKVGDVVVLQNICFSSSEQPRMTDAPSFRDYLLKEHVVGSVFLYGPIDYGLICRPSWSLARWVWQLREGICNGLKKKLSPRTLRYFSLIFLGNKYQEKTEDLRQTFSYWGLSHYLARAGLHIILFIIVWQFFLNLLPIHLLAKRALLIALCVIYGCLSWYSIPFARAMYSFLLSEGGRFFGFQPTFFHTLTLLCCIILLFSPMQLFFLDFQLTFGLTFVLSWYGRFTAPNKQE